MTDFYLELMPDYIPHEYHESLIYISGIIEILLGALSIFRITRKWACIGVVFLLIAVFPANIYHFQTYWDQKNMMTWITGLRLPVQIVLIFWAWWIRKD